MKRYADIDKLYNSVKDNVGAYWSEGEEVKEECLNEIYNAPTADVVEIRHGYWIFINQAVGYLEPPYGDTLKCSLCEFVIDVSEGNFNYCPNCGAKMDGERREE